MKPILSLLTLSLLISSWPASYAQAELESLAESTNAVATVSGAGDGTRVDTNGLTAEWTGRLAPESAGKVLFVPGTNGAGRPAGVRSAPAAARVAPPAGREEIEITPTGARARFGPHQVAMASDVRTEGAVEVTTPGGVRLRSHILGLCYLDAASGRSVLIAELQSRVGEVVYPNRVAYRDALDTARADVVYTYTRSSLEQDVVLRAQLPSPGELGLAGEDIHLAVMTEFVDAPAPRRTVQGLTVADPLAPAGSPPVVLADETLGFGSLRIVAGKAFSVGESGTPVPVYKRWEVIEGRSFLIEATPWRWVAARLAALPPYAGVPGRRAVMDLTRLLAGLRGGGEPAPLLARMERSLWRVEDEPGLVLDYLMVNQALLNVNFANATKYGEAAVGQYGNDTWNVYDFPGETEAALTGLCWSDWTVSAIGLVVSNAPATGQHPVIGDPMYGSCVLGTNHARLTVTLTNLPADVYDVLVYAPRATANGVPVVELKRAGVSLWVKSLTQWGTGWRSPLWEEHEQYVRFRDIAVTNQPLTVEILPDAAGYAPLSGLQIVPAEALPAESPVITRLLNINFPGNTPDKVGFAAVGQTEADYWNERPNATAGATANLKLADGTMTAAGILVRNAAGAWGFASVPDLMYQNYIYGGSGGNTTLILTNLPSGTCHFYIYGHTTNYPDNGIFELWSDEVNWGIKGTSIHGPGPATTNWQVGQQFVLFRDVAVSSNRPVILHAKHSTYGYQNINGLQIVYTGELDTDADGLPDAWELKWFGHLDYSGSDDPDQDGVPNWREYQLGLDPLRGDSNSNGVPDGLDAETVWLEDASPQGCYQYTAGGDTWNWVTSWSDGVGWNGGTVYPYSGEKMRVTANTTNTIHQHFFERAVSVIRPGTGDVLYAYVNLDPTKPPSEVMLQFYTLGNNGTYGREHRAYWGANNIAYGTDGTVSRTNLGALPPAGQWVRLQVPASVVGLEGKIIEGMNFTLYGGRAAWDRAGVFNPDLDGDGLVDLDGDGLPDSWELQHFGNLNQDGDGDPDGDGIPNLWEFRWGLNPLVYDSRNGLGGAVPLRVFTPLK